MVFGLSIKSRVELIAGEEVVSGLRDIDQENRFLDLDEVGTGVILHVLGVFGVHGDEDGDRVGVVVGLSSEDGSLTEESEVVLEGEVCDSLLLGNLLVIEVGLIPGSLLTKDI